VEQGVFEEQVRDKKNFLTRQKEKIDSGMKDL